MPPTFHRHSEEFLSDYIEIYKKEINKRRNCLENQAEEELGLPSPWRRTRNKGLKRRFFCFLKKALVSIRFFDL